MAKREKNKKAPERRSRFCSLSPQLLADRTIDLIAYRIAQRVFWAQAMADRDESLDAIYLRVLALLPSPAGKS